MASLTMTIQSNGFRESVPKASSKAACFTPCTKQDNKRPPTVFFKGANSIESKEIDSMWTEPSHRNQTTSQLGDL
jgi:hypothetical protein